MYMDPLNDRFIKSIEDRYEKEIKEKDDEIQRLKGADGEKDAEICKKIREKIMQTGSSAEQIEQLTAALANMMTVIGRKE